MSMAEKKTTKKVEKAPKADKVESKPSIFEKLFYGLNLTWPKLIIASIVIGVFVGILMAIPALKDTSLTRIGVIMYWWVFFGTIIITNSKKPLESALKCFVFFLISQPLIYLVQVPFAEMGWGLFGYYHYWFMWTLATIPLGFVGNWLLKYKNIWSALTLGMALMIVALEGAGEFTIASRQFPKYLLSGFFCVAIFIVILLGVLKSRKLRGLTIAFAIVASVIVAFVNQAQPEDIHYGLVYGGEDYGITTDKVWWVESDLGDRLYLTKEHTYDDEGNELEEEVYYIIFNGDGNDIGIHDVRFFTEDESKNCQLVIEQQERALTCEE